MSRRRDYCFTINNYVESDLISLEEMKASGKVQYMIVGDEVGEECGTPHLQGYVYFSHPKVFGTIKKLLPRAHFPVEGTKGNALQNKLYCSKQKVLFEYGEMPQQGARTDIPPVMDVLKDSTITGKMRAVTEIATSYQSVRMAEVWLKYHEEKRKWKPEIRWFWGPPGAGKTQAAYDWVGDDDVWESGMDGGKWFDGYDGHANIVFDDFRKDFCKFWQLLRLTDSKPIPLPIKGTFRQMLAKKIAITSVYHPEDVYDTREDIWQLIRRLTNEGENPEWIVAIGNAIREKDKIQFNEDD